MSPRSETPTDASDELMPQVTVPAYLVWAAAVVIAGVAVVGLIAGLHQTPSSGLGVFGVGTADQPAVGSASAAVAKPLTGDKWSTLTGPQITSSASETSQSKASSAAAPSDQAPADRTAAAAAAPSDAARPPEAAPPPASANSAQPDSMQNYY